MTMITRKFRNFLRKSKFNKSEDTNKVPLYFKCNKLEHMKKDCTLFKTKVNFNSFNKFNKFKKKKAF